MSTALNKPNLNHSQTEAFEFTLILTGIDEITEDVENALFEAGCNDALLGKQNGEIFLDFSREAESPVDALVSAIQDVQSAQIQGLEVLEVRPPNKTIIDAVNIYLKFRQLAENKLSFDDEAWRVILKMQQPHQD